MPSPEIRTLVLAEPVESERWHLLLGSERASDVASRHDRLLRDLLARFDGREIEKTHRFLLLFGRPVDAVRFALAYQDELAVLAGDLEMAIAARVGIHLGEVVLRENPAEQVARGAKPLELEGPARGRVREVVSLGRGRQILLTRTAHDLARRAFVGDSAGKDLRWVDHGLYRFRPDDEPVEVFEVGAGTGAPLTAPGEIEEVRRVARVGRDEAMAWHPTQGQTIPQRPNWILEERLGRPAFGDTWLALHKKTRDQQVFKFCIEPDDILLLKRQIAVLENLKDTLAQRRDVVRIVDWNLDEPPFFLESRFDPGRNLPDWSVARGGLGQIPLDARVDLVAQLAEAVAAVHAAGEVQGDLRPSNVLVIEEGDERRIRLAEPAIGRVSDPELAAIRRRRAVSRDPGREAGLYRAPELDEAGLETPRTDVYALGVILYQVAAADFGRPLGPFWRRDVADPLIRDDIARFTEPAPEARVAEADEVARGLRRLASRRDELEKERQRREHETAGRREAARRRLRFWQGLAAALGAVAFLLGVLVALLVAR